MKIQWRPDPSQSAAVSSGSPAAAEEASGNGGPPPKDWKRRKVRAAVNGGGWILGYFSQPFATVSDMVRFYSKSKLPIKGAEHMCLLRPVVDRLL